MSFAVQYNLRRKEAQAATVGQAGQGRAGQSRAGQGRAGQGRAGQGRAGQSRAGQGRGRVLSTTQAYSRVSVNFQCTVMTLHRRASLHPASRQDRVGYCTTCMDRDFSPVVLVSSAPICDTAQLG